jgi:hypothetical protein
MNLTYCILKPAWVLNKSPICMSSTTRFHSVDHRASSKLFTDAKHEEATPSQPTILRRTIPKHTNWAGDESIEDAVLRMLVDKYKLLRTGTVQTAEEKLRRTPPIVSAQPPAILSISETPMTTPSPSPPSSSVCRADEPILQPVEGHKPWLTKFKAPSHVSASIRYGEFPTAPPPTPTTSVEPSQSVRATERADDLARRKDRDAQKRSEIAGPPHAGERVYARLPTGHQEHRQRRTGAASAPKPREYQRVDEPRRGAHRSGFPFPSHPVKVTLFFFHFRRLSTRSMHVGKDTSAVSADVGAHSSGAAKSTTRSSHLRSSSSTVSCSGRALRHRGSRCSASSIPQLWHFA